MQNLVPNLARLLALSLLMWAAQTASAFYDPNIQRWISRDPIGEAGGLNLYQALGNNPVGLIDVFGLKLVVDDSCGENFDKAKDYLLKCPEARALFEKLEKSPELWRLTCNTRNENMCEDKTKSVNWDPNSAVLIRNNDAQSPALGLFHEFLHAVNPSVSEQKIIDLEAVCAKALGEPARKTAADWQYTFRAPNPVERAPIPPPPWRTQFPPPQYQKLPTLPKKK